MSLSLDHVVVAVADLEATTADWRRLGFTVTAGGEHTGRASHNALVVLADGVYFELIAYRAPVPENRWWRELDRAGDGFVDFAVRPQAIEEDLAAARNRGLDIDGPVAGGRRRPDGVRLDWSVARPATTDLPFWCADVTERRLRVPEGTARDHPNGVTGVAAITVAVADLAASAVRWRRLLGEAAVAIGPDGVAVDLAGVHIDLVDDREPVAAARLARRGEGVLKLALAGPAAADLDPALTHGAPIAIVTGRT